MEKTLISTFVLEIKGCNQKLQKVQTSIWKTRLMGELPVHENPFEVHLRSFTQSEQKRELREALENVNKTLKLLTCQCYCEYGIR